MTDHPNTTDDLDELIEECSVIEHDDNENDEKVIDVTKLKQALTAYIEREKATLLNELLDKGKVYGLNDGRLLNATPQSVIEQKKTELSDE